MLVSINWLKQLVDLEMPIEELIDLIPFRVQGGIKESNDNSFELDLKGYNRADLLSLRGVAYEVAAITDSKITFQEPTESDYAWADQNLSQIKVDVRDDKLCPFYCVARIEGLKVDESPADEVQKLTESGIRSVNNIADVTNLVMLEYGQPLHAFDGDKVSGGEIVVRRAAHAEAITTLDDKERRLEDADLLIADPEKPLAIAGVMGGQNSEVTEQTTTVLLEAAIFDPASLRKTTNKLALQSEASKRFYHGLTKIRLMQALDAAIKKYQALGGRLTAITFVGDYPQADVDISLRHHKVESLIGVEIDAKQIEESLTKLNFTMNQIGDGEWKVMPPYWRLDCQIEEDLIEEVARMYGYEKIPAKALEGEAPKEVDQSHFELVDRLKQTLIEVGLTELQTYTFWSQSVLENLNIPRSQLVRLANPMSAETEYLRTELWPNLLEKAALNLKKFEQIAVFEIGKIYEPHDNEIPQESYRLAILLANQSDDPTQELVAVVNKLGLDVAIVPHQEAVNETFHPIRQADLEYNGQRVGLLAEVHPRVLRRFGVDQRIAIAELRLGF